MWYAWGSEAVLILEALLPYLVGKREQAELAIAFQKEKSLRQPRVRVSDDELAWQRAQSDGLKALREQIKANS